MTDLSARQLVSQPIRSVLLRPRSAALTAAAVCLQLLTVLPIPFLISRIFDHSIPDGDSAGIIRNGLAVIGLFVLGALASVWLQRLLIGLAESIGREMRDRIVERAHELPLAELARRGRDDVFDLLVWETTRVGNAVSVALTHVGPAAIMVAGLGVVLFVIDWLLFLVAALFAPAMILMNLVLTGRIRDRQVALNGAQRVSSAGVLRTLNLMPLTRVSGATDVEIARQLGSSKDLERELVRQSFASGMYTASQQAIVVASALVTLIVGGIGVIDGRITLGTLFSFYAGIALIRPALDRLVHARPVLTSGRLGVDRIDEFFQVPTNRSYGGTAPLNFTGRVEVDAVEFGYTPDTIVVGPVSFVLHPGELTVLTGPNGSGKSTLIDLLCGFYRPTHGIIRADGHGFDEVDIAAVRRRTGVVFQDPYILDATIGENLRYGLGEVEPSVVATACRLAQFDEVLARLPGGESTVLGDAAHRLSGGQAQRLAIARALVRQPCLLLLDEPTNHLDVVTLERVIDNLLELDRSPTVVVVTHDQRVIDLADQVVELEHPDLRSAGRAATVRRAPRG